MNSSGTEPFLNDLDLSLAKAWALLADGRKNRNSPLHTPVIGSVDGQGSPSQRVMVLRSVDEQARTLRFNTDSRSAKANQIGDGTRICVLGYHAEAKVQLRMWGTGFIHRNGEAREAAWARATAFSKRCYLADPGPGSSIAEAGSGLPAELEGQRPTEEQLVAAKENFAVLEFCMDKMEWLYLAHTGHRRAVFTWHEDDGQWDGEWIIP